MARSSRKKISTEASAQPLGGLDQALSGLNLGALPEGPKEASPRKEDARSGIRRIVLRRETAHRGGKAVTILGQFEPTPPSEELASLAKALRQHCGCGGAVKNGEIELQGEQATAARAWLEGKGIRVDGVR